MLIKMKNKNKNAYELFMKRRRTYEMNKMKEDKLTKTGYYDDKDRRNTMRMEKINQQKNIKLGNQKSNKNDFDSEN